MNDHNKEDFETGVIILTLIGLMLYFAHYMNKKECLRSGGEYAAFQCDKNED